MTESASFSGASATTARPAGTKPLCVVILTFNEEINLPQCLRSLAGLNCDIFVVDSGSTDGTLSIAEAANAAIASHPFENYGLQRNWAIRNMPLNSPWTLHIDADERLTPELVTEINQTIAADPQDVQGFMLRKRTYFLGRWMRHGGHYPSFHLRLFRNGRGRCEDRLYDQHFMVDGKTAVLKHDYIDVVASTLKSWSIRHIRWAEMEAQEMINGPGQTDQVTASLTGDKISQIRWLRSKFYGKWPLFVRPFAYWAYRYFLRLGFLDGPEGLIFHFLQGCWFRFLIDCNIFEQTRLSKHSHEDSRS